MFHLKLLTKETHKDLAAIQSTLIANPKRHFTTQLDGYDFQENNIKQLLQNQCGVCIQKEDGFLKDKIQEFISLGNKKVVIEPKGFSVPDLSIHLEKGASIVVRKSKEFDLSQIGNLVMKGGENTFVMGENIKEPQLEIILNNGGSILLKNGDLNPFAISRLVAIGNKRLYIHASKFSEDRIDDFLNGKAKVIFGKRNLLSKDQIAVRVKKHKTQTYIISDAFKFAQDWVKEMEKAKAIII